MADPKAPETWESLRAAACELGSTAGQLTRVLSAHGLAIVSEADRKVLEANAALDSDWLDKCKFSRDIRLFRFAEAELARRSGT